MNAIRAYIETALRIAKAKLAEPDTFNKPKKLAAVQEIVLSLQALLETLNDD